jgi:predicted phosphodiesterase
MRVYAWSDLHADYAANRDRIAAAAGQGTRGDVLLVAGDVSDRLETLARTLELLRTRFAELFFVPGNHEAWLRGGGFADSQAKLDRIEALCAELGVRTRPARLGQGGEAVWIVPLASWYVRPEHGEDSLFVAKAGEDASQSLWADDVLVRWPDGDAGAAARRLLRGNEPHLERSYDAPVVSFSHFLPRREVMFRAPEEQASAPRQPDRHPAFNFSRVAGSLGIERQLRALGSRVHVYGHQHRNRDRVLDGVRYVSHCLGYPGEGAAEDAQRPKLVYNG